MALHTNLSAKDLEHLWMLYMQLIQRPPDLKTHPIPHQFEQPVDAHILVAFQTYCLMVTLKKRSEQHGPSLTRRGVLAKLASLAENEPLGDQEPTKCERSVSVRQSFVILEKWTEGLGAAPQKLLHSLATKADRIQGSHSPRYVGTSHFARSVWAECANR
jgi:hypothetical protein